MEMNENKSGDDSLRDWFTKSRASDGTPGWVQLGGKYAGKPCAKQPGQTTKPKCGSSKMKRALNSGEEEAAFRRKNRKDPNPDARGRAINVATEEKDHEVSMAQSQLANAKANIAKLQKRLGKKEKNIPAWMQAKITDADHNMDAAATYKEEKDACYHKVKSRYKKWPSAYASGALVKCRKVGADSWGNKSEGVSFQQFQEKALKCWKGCRRVAGTVAGTKGSCTCEDIQQEDWQKVNKSDNTDGMSKAAVDAYRRENPDSKLKTAVTGDPKPGSKDAKRRANYCRRSKGQQDMHNIDCSADPDKPICQARRRWKC